MAGKLYRKSNKNAIKKEKHTAMSLIIEIRHAFVES
jgi:hypothetical protein